MIPTKYIVLIVTLASSWFVTILFAVVDVPPIFLIIWIIKSLLITGWVMYHIRQLADNQTRSD